MNLTNRSSLIISGSYYDSLMSAAIKDNKVRLLGHVNPKLIGEETKEAMDNSTLSFASSGLVHKSKLERRFRYSKYRSEVLQMMLFFERTILFDPNLYIDYDGLLSSGHFELAESPANFFKGIDSPTREYAGLIKPIVIETLIELIEKRKMNFLYPFKVNKRSWLEKLFYFYMEWEPGAGHRDEFEALSRDIEIAANLEVELNTLQLSPYFEGGNRDIVVKMFVDWLPIQIAHETEKLMAMVDYSNKNKGVLLQSEYKFEGKDSENSILETRKVQRLIDSYSILRISLQKKIGSLPALSSIDDVFKIKEKKRKQIERLKEVLSEIEFNLREERHTGYKTAVNHINAAVRDLNRAERLEKVNNWTTYLSLPVGAIEAILSLPPIAGLTLGSVGAIATLKTQRAKEKNDWINIVR